jgi:hypothetical protein
MALISELCGRNGHAHCVSTASNFTGCMCDRRCRSMAAATFAGVELGARARGRGPRCPAGPPAQGWGPLAAAARAGACLPTPKMVALATSNP